MKSRRVHRPVLVTPVSRRAACGWWHAVIVLGLLLGNLALYYRTLDLGFLPLDDPDYVQNNPHLEPFNAANLRHLLTAAHLGNHAPLHLLSYAVDIALAGGKSAVALHLSSVLWHGWVVCMVYWLAWTLRPNLPSAAGAALLFLVHPAHVEVVAWISSRKDLVATGFGVLAMICYLRYRRCPGAPAWWWYGGSVLSFLLASAAKQSVVLLPAVMLVWDALVDRRRGWGMVLDKIPIGLVALFFAWLNLGSQPATHRGFDVFVPVTTLFRDLGLLTGLGDYVLYHSNVFPGAWSWAVRVWALAAAALVWLAPLWWLRRVSALPAGLAYWVLICLVPPMVMNFTTPVTDRYLFLPSVGFCLLLAELVARLANRAPAHRQKVFALLPGLALLWSVRTWDYLSEWRDPRSVWHGATAKSNASQVYQYLGEVYQEAADRLTQFAKSGQPLQAPRELALARAVLGEPARVEALRAEWVGASPARTNSLAYRDQLWALAWEQYEKAAARRGTLSTPNLYLRRGKLLVDQGQAAKALPELELALAFARSHSYRQTREESVTHILRALGIAHWNLRNYPEAKRWYLEAQAVQRQSSRTWIPTLDQEVERITRVAGSGDAQ